MTSSSGSTTVSILCDGCYCRSDWQDEDDSSLVLTLVKPTTSQAWSARIDSNILGTVASKVGANISIEEVLKLTKSTLSGESDKYTYSIDEDQLVWKKVAGLAKMTLVKIELTEKPFLETQKSFFEFLINENKQLQSTNDNLQRKQESLVLSLKQSHATLEVFEKEKNEMEERLYSKFLPILNSKKDEILRLKNNFSAPEDDNDYGDETDEDEDVLDSKRQKS